METSDLELHSKEVELKDSDTQALDDILRSPEKLKVLLSEVKRLSNDVDSHKERGKLISDEIKDVAKENFKLSTKKFNELIADWNSGKLEDRIANKTSTVDVLEEFNRITKGD